MEKLDSGLKRIYSKVAADTAEELVFRNHALYELGMLYYEKCDFANASDCFEKVKTEALQFHLYDNYFKAVAKLMRIHAERMDFEEQSRLQREALQVGASLANFRRYQPILHYNRGIAALYQRNAVEALGEFSKAEQLGVELLTDARTTDADRTEVQRWTLYSRYGRAVVAKDQARLDEALQILRQLLQEIQRLHEVAEGIDLYELEASVGITEGHCLRDKGDHKGALERYWYVHRLLKTKKNWNFYYYVLLGLGRTHQIMGDHVKATTFFELIRDSIQNLELNSLKSTLNAYWANSQKKCVGGVKLVLDRERKRVIEEKMGEVHFERRFVLLEILYLLSGEPGRIFSKEELVRDIWSESYNPMIHDSKVYTSISRLRKLIEPDFKHPKYILNERDGYAFNPNVQVVEMSEPGVFGKTRGSVGATATQATQ